MCTITLYTHARMHTHTHARTTYVVGDGGAEGSHRKRRTDLLYIFPEGQPMNKTNQNFSKKNTVQLWWTLQCTTQTHTRRTCRWPRHIAPQGLPHLQRAAPCSVSRLTARAHRSGPVVRAGPILASQLLMDLAKAVAGPASETGQPLLPSHGYGPRGTQATFCTLSCLPENPTPKEPRRELTTPSDPRAP